IPFLFFKTELLKYSVVLSIFALFVVGAARTYYTKRNPIKSGLEMVLIGSIAALIGYYFGEFINSLF
ncbi:MAG: VIT1/CCC1 transporter family protein, partial [Nanoarchaeota archaeon]